MPTLSPSDPCVNASSQYVPSKAVRLQDLPPIQYQYVAFAPWFSPVCTQSYLAAAHGISAFLFYAPSQNNSATPPPPNDQLWNLGDGGRWKSKNKYPVYAISGADGASLMQQLAQYSGKMSEVKNGNVLVQEFDPTDYIRLYATFNTDGSSNLPTLWAFLLIVLGIVLLLVGLTSFSMHYIQRRNRLDLQRRVQNGEVDIESLGIKRPCLTQTDIDSLPLIPYIPNEKKPPLPLDPSITTTTTTTTSTYNPNAPTPPTTAASPQDYNQPTCPICLDDYIPNETPVRCLPCHHIFHPDCIGPHLLTRVDCPMCKQLVSSSLFPPCTPGSGDPGRACPPITNAMVRRERQERRRQEQRANPSPVSRWETIQGRFSLPLGNTPLVRTRTGRRMTRSRPSVGGTAARVGAIVEEPTTSQIEMGTLARPEGGTIPIVSGTVVAAPGIEAEREGGEVGMRPPPQDSEGRREWARRRASALLGRGGEGHADVGVVGTLDEEDVDRRDGMPRCEFPLFTRS